MPFPHSYIPECPSERRSDGEEGDVLGLSERPVVGGERARHRHLTQRHDEVCDPEKHEQLEGLQVGHESENDAT